MASDQSGVVQNSSPRKALVRFYSSTNLGDDLFVYILGQRYQNTFYVNNRVRKGAVRNFANFEPSESLLEFIITRILARLFRRPLLLSTRNEKRVDLMVYVGGSIFQEGPSLTPWWRQEELYRELKVPYYILGANFGPYKSSEFKEIISNIIAGSIDTCFRDRYSFDQFKEIPVVRHSTDIAFSLDTSTYLSEEKHRIALISVIDTSWRFESSIVNQYEKEMANMAKNLYEEGYSVTFMSFCKKEGDERSIDRILQLFPAVEQRNFNVFFYDGNLEKALNLFSQAEIVVGSRFHSVILGLLFKARTLPVIYSDKTLEILNDIHFESPTIDIRTLNDFDRQKFDFNLIQPVNVDKQIQLANTQFAELDKVLKRR